MKKFTALLLAFILVIGLTACGSGTGAGNGTGSGDTSTGGISKSSQEFIDALNAENAEEKGVCGADLTWYYKDNVLVIKGTGPMNDYNYWFSDPDAPWYDKGLMDKIHWLIIEEGVTSIGDGAFWGIVSLSKVELPSTIETIGDGAFDNTRSLKSITIPSSVTAFGDGTFNDSSIESINIPDGIQEFGEKVFSGCNFTTLVIPDSVTRIGSGAFFGCDSLSSITIPDSVTTIGRSAFSYCGSLSSITIPSSVKELGNSAFYCSMSLTSVTFEGDAPKMEEADSIFNKCELEQLTVTYSGSGFEPLIEAYPEINWVKK